MEFSFFSQTILYIVLGLMGIYSLIVWGWQINVLRGKSMQNADGSFDSEYSSDLHT